MWVAQKGNSPSWDISRYVQHKKLALMDQEQVFFVLTAPRGPPSDGDAGIEAPGRKCIAVRGSLSHQLFLPCRPPSTEAADDKSTSPSGRQAYETSAVTGTTCLAFRSRVFDIGRFDRFDRFDTAWRRQTDGGPLSQGAYQTKRTDDTDYSLYNKKPSMRNTTRDQLMRKEHEENVRASQSCRQIPHLPFRTIWLVGSFRGAAVPRSGRTQAPHSRECLTIDGCGRMDLCLMLFSKIFGMGTPPLSPIDTPHADVRQAIGRSTKMDGVCAQRCNARVLD
ncbi:hypothetical protein MKZ38_001694 [Zalerion maritima]|uniref:Uncharacterized protein n=1 Tax=Zalerion maritima TaxID=339359 RepID=A0AAD5WTN6_9PEZI|nr:hypothetical protein MKZ38_001694 [Zalerion maritima]